MNKLNACIFLSFLLCVMMACRRDDKITDPPHKTSSYTFVLPPGISTSAMYKNPLNPTTIEGVELGRRLFYDPILSGNNTQSCASCHSFSHSFSDTLALSNGSEGGKTARNAMPLFNLAWSSKFFWDGGAPDLESQVIGPVTNPVEMHQDLNELTAEITSNNYYRILFKRAFGTDSVTTKLVMNAIAQFERTITSYNSKYDYRYYWNKPGYQLTPAEFHGMQIFEDTAKGDCFHCHVFGSTFTDFDFKNNGLDTPFDPNDQGRAKITGRSSDIGKFKTPSLRNLSFTAPYMHDGRFKTLMEVIDFYDHGFHYVPNLDPNIAARQKFRLSPQDKQDLIAFLKTLDDYTIKDNPAYRSPF